MTVPCRHRLDRRRQHALAPRRQAWPSLALTLLMALGCQGPPSPLRMHLKQPSSPPPSPADVRTAYEHLLAQYLTNDSLVDFDALADDEQARRALDNYLVWAAAIEPNHLSSQAARRAFYINVYNAAALRAVLTFWPIERLSDCPVDIETALQFNIARQWVTLAQLAALAQSPPPQDATPPSPQYQQAALTTFALALPIQSHPSLSHELYEPNQLDEQLRTALAHYLGSCAGLQVDYATKTVLFGPLVIANRDFFEQWYANRLGTRGVSLLSVMTPWTTPPTQTLLADAVGFATATLEYNDLLRHTGKDNELSHDQTTAWAGENRLCGRR